MLRSDLLLVVLRLWFTGDGLNMVPDLLRHPVAIIPGVFY